VNCEEEFDEILISCVHSLPEIFHPSKKSYKDRVVKVNAWKGSAAFLERVGKFIVPAVSSTFIQYQIIFCFLYCFEWTG
jgi:hypothetical protein